MFVHWFLIGLAIFAALALLFVTTLGLALARSARFDPIEAPPRCDE